MPAQLDYHARLLHYDAWANAETLAALRRTPVPAGLRWLGHIVASECLWLGRLQEQPSALPVWPDLAPDEIAARLDRLAHDWTDYLSGLTGDDLPDGVGYRNTQGEFWTNTVGDILTHVVTHSAYHRGQIAAAVRAAGGEPAYTDFIHAVRRGLVQ